MVQRIAEQVLEQLHSELGRELFDTVLTQFFEEGAQRWQRLQQAAQNADTAALAREAHTLAGMCRSFGLQACGEEFAGLQASALNTELIPQDALSALGQRWYADCELLRNMPTAAGATSA